MNTQFEFEHESLRVFMQKTREASAALIAEIIKEHSPIQKDEDIESLHLGENKRLRVTRVTLEAISSFGWPGERLSFSYEGIPLAKNGEPMKNRKPISFSHFQKDGEKYYMPSYNRVEIVPTQMHT